MATEMCFFLAQDSDLDRLRNDEDAVASLVEKRDRARELIAFGANHRNVGIFHFILNGTSALVAGPCGLFESWLHGDQYRDIRLTETTFGLNSTGVRALADALSQLDDAAVSRRWDQWKAVHNIVKDDDPTFFPECFGFLRDLCSRAVSGRQALLWTVG